MSSRLSSEEVAAVAHEIDTWNQAHDDPVMRALQIDQIEHFYCAGEVYHVRYTDGDEETYWRDPSDGKIHPYPRHTYWAERNYSPG